MEVWSSEDKQDALTCVQKLESFDFVYSTVTVFLSLLYLKQTAVSIQGKNKDLIVSGVSTVMQCYEELKKKGNRIFRLISVYLSA